MNRPISFLALVTAVTALTATGCGKNPTAPEAGKPDPGPTIMTPLNATISKIEIAKFPSRTTGGDEWDISVVAASRRPDLYVVLTRPNLPGDFTSNTVSNAEYGTKYGFTTGPGGDLPATIPYGTSRRVYVMDEDFGGSPDRLGWITVHLPNAYQDDNARDFDHTFTDSGNRLSVRVMGTWAY
jgi:hypothetical protein